MTDSYIGYEVECEGGGGPSTPSPGGTLKIVEVARSTAKFAVPTTFVDTTLTFPTSITDDTRLILALYQSGGTDIDPAGIDVIHKGWLFLAGDEIPTATGVMVGDDVRTTGEARTDIWDYYLQNTEMSLVLDENRRLFVRTHDGRVETGVFCFFILFTVG